MSSVKNAVSAVHRKVLLVSVPLVKLCSLRLLLSVVMVFLFVVSSMVYSLSVFES